MQTFVKNHEKTVGVGTDAFYLRVLLDLGHETGQHLADYLDMVDVAGKMAKAAGCIVFFVLPRSVGSDRPIFYAGQRSLAGVSGLDLGCWRNKRMKTQIIERPPKKQEVQCGRPCWS